VRRTHLWQEPLRRWCLCGLSVCVCANSEQSRWVENIKIRQQMKGKMKEFVDISQLVGGSLFNFSQYKHSSFPSPNGVCFKRSMSQATSAKHRHACASLLPWNCLSLSHMHDYIDSLIKQENTPAHNTPHAHACTLHLTLDKLPVSTAGQTWQDLSSWTCRETSATVPCQ
jgi:hypothetical protein